MCALDGRFAVVFFTLAAVQVDFVVSHFWRDSWGRRVP